MKEKNELEMVTLEAPVGSLILSPRSSKQRNIDLFNNWMEDNYENKR